MNYRHAYHAGNFADLLKHAALTAVLTALRHDPAPLQVLDTHAGAGLYDLGAEMAAKSGEAQAGIARLMADEDAPPAFGALKAAVRAVNPGGGLRLYPGSPVLTAQGLRPGDAYLGCELRSDDHALLARALSKHGGGQAQALQGDGYEQAARAAPLGMRRMVLIDPPFEAADEYRRITEAVAAVLSRDPGAAMAIWVPIKDLDTFDRFITGLESVRPPRLVIVEARLRPLDQPLRLNGCAMAIVGAPTEIEPAMEAAARWAVKRLGDAGGAARLWRPA